MTNGIVWLSPSPPQRGLGLTRDAATGLVYVYTPAAVYELAATQEDKHAWRQFLDRAQNPRQTTSQPGDVIIQLLKFSAARLSNQDKTAVFNFIMKQKDTEVIYTLHMDQWKFSRQGFFCSKRLDSPFCVSGAAKLIPPHTVKPLPFN